MTLLHALANTTHPTAFRVVVHTVEWSLRHQAHPNFIRWTICNGNAPRVVFARGLGVAGILGGIICAILITLSNAGRGWRVLSAIGFMIGVATLIAAWKGMCVVCFVLNPGFQFMLSSLILSRSSTACTIAIFAHGSFSPKRKTNPPWTWARVLSTLLAAPLTTKTSLGLPNTRNAISSVKSSIAKSGSKSRLFGKSRTPSSCKLSEVH